MKASPTLLATCFISCLITSCKKEEAKAGDKITVPAISPENKRSLGLVEGESSAEFTQENKLVAYLEKEKNYELLKALQFKQTQLTFNVIEQKKLIPSPKGDFHYEPWPDSPALGPTPIDGFSSELFTPTQ